MMSTVTVQQAQADLPRLIAGLQPGESVGATQCPACGWSYDELDAAEQHRSHE